MKTTLTLLAALVTLLGSLPAYATHVAQRDAAPGWATNFRWEIGDRGEVEAREYIAERDAAPGWATNFRWEIGDRGEVEAGEHIEEKRDAAPGWATNFRWEIGDRDEPIAMN